MSAFSTINTAMNGLRAHQRALDVTAHNVANSNTPGYHRQEAMFEALSPVGVGSGVEVAYVRRLQDSFLAQQARGVDGQAGRWSAARQGLEQIETVLAPGTGLGVSDMLDSFFGAWQDLSTHPETTAAREVVLGNARTLTDALHRAATGLDALGVQLDTAVASDVERVNGLADQIAGLNARIGIAKASGGDANDLLDQRDLIVRDLGTLAGVSSYTPDNGAPVINIGGHTLVEGNIAYHLTYVSDSGGPRVMWEGTSNTAEITSGEIAGRLEVRTTGITTYGNDLDALAQALATSVNNLHAEGFNQDGAATAGYTFFEGATAHSLRVSDTVAADARKIATTRTAGAVGDGRLAGEIANLVRAPLIGSKTLNESLAGMNSEIGTAVQTAKTNAAVSTALSEQMSARQQAAVGVSLDEEMASMLMYQRGYDASARVLQVADEMLRTLLQLVG